MVLTDFEREVLAEVSKERAWEHVQWFAGVKEKLSGTAEFEKAVDYVTGTLKGYGVDPVVYEFQAFLSLPRQYEAELKVLEPEKRALECRACAGIESTPPEGVEGELVYVGHGGLEDYKGKYVKNRIVLAERISSPIALPWKNYVAGTKGAKGMIIISFAGTDRRVFNKGTVKSVWGNPTPEEMEDIGRIPVVNITTADGEYLKKLLEKGSAKVWMKAECTREWMRGREPMATIRGTEPKFVLLGSHLDAWGGASSCNAIGCASTLEIARVLSRFRSHLRRGVEFLWFQGHENGIMTGSTWYVDNLWDNLHRNCVAYFNNDSYGMLYQTVYDAGGDPVFDDFLKSTVKELAEEEKAPFTTRTGKYRPSKTGDQSFYGLGIPSGRAATTASPEVINKLPYRYNWWYHAEEDLLDKADAEALYMANKAQTLVILRLCTLPVLPYRVARVSDWMIDVLKELDTKAKGALSLTDLVEKAAAFKEVALSLDEALSRLSEECKERAEVEGLREEIQAANDGLLKICRILSPVNYTFRGRYEQDYYGAEYVKPIAALQPVAELATLNPDSSYYKALRTKLVRNRNMVSDALEDATWFAEHTTNKVKAK
jgi:hypothetical protein